MSLDLATNAARIKQGFFRKIREEESVAADFVDLGLGCQSGVNNQWNKVKVLRCRLNREIYWGAGWILENASKRPCLADFSAYYVRQDGSVAMNVEFRNNDEGMDRRSLLPDNTRALEMRRRISFAL